MQRGSQPTYQQGLGAIGRYLDQHGFEDLILCELGDGFVGRVMLDGRLVEAIPFSISDLNNMVRSPNDDTGRTKGASPHAPNSQGSFLRRTLGGYRDFMRALGHQCDLLEVNSFLLVELPLSVLVAYRRAPGSFDSTKGVSCEYLYDESGIHTLLNGNASLLRS
jgi:hypothetical protein